MRLTGRIALFAMLLSQPACGPSITAETRRPTNVVLILLDSVRADHVGAYGYSREVTPTLDALAAKGLLFERAYAGSSSTLQSLSALWTGRLPTSGGSIGRDEATPHSSLVTLPRLFLRNGFRTGIAANVPALRDRAFTRGFDDVEIDSIPGRWTGELVTTKALEIVDQLSDAPLFLTVAYGDATEPHLPLDEYRRRIDTAPPVRLLSLPELRASAGSLPENILDSPGFLDLVARYDAEVAYVDACVGALVDGLRDRGLLDDTLLIVTSTHGTELLEHGYVGSGWTLYEETLRVPLIVHAPAFLAPQRTRDPVSTVDLAPSLRDVFCADTRAGVQDGYALFRSDATGLHALPAKGQVIAELVVPALCVLRASIQADWKLIEAVEWAPAPERLERLAAHDETRRRIQSGELPAPDLWAPPTLLELYELTRDPGEARDEAASRPEVVARLEALLERYRVLCQARGLPAAEAALPSSAPGPDLEQLDQLRQVGYL